jgi:hypothetical protein
MPTGSLEATLGPHSFTHPAAWGGLCSHICWLTACCCPPVAPCSVDIFFLDWEKPRRILAKGGGREEPGPISAWRTLLVANEWNELQTLRFTCPAFTLLTAVSAFD